MDALITVTIMPAVAWFQRFGPTSVRDGVLGDLDGEHDMASDADQDQLLPDGHDDAAVRGPALDGDRLAAGLV